MQNWHKNFYIKEKTALHGDIILNMRLMFTHLSLTILFLVNILIDDQWGKYSLCTMKTLMFYNDTLLKYAPHSINTLSASTRNVN